MKGTACCSERWVPGGACVGPSSILDMESSQRCEWKKREEGFDGDAEGLSFRTWRHLIEW